MSKNQRILRQYFNVNFLFQVRRLEEEKKKLRELHEEERRKVEDLQFRLEEEEMAKEAGTDDDLIKKVLEEKNREIVALKLQIDSSKAQTDSLQHTLIQKEEEVDRYVLTY